MPFVLIVAGLVLFISAVRNTQDRLFKLVQGDFLGANNFIYWFVAIMIIGAIGYVPKLKPISTAFLILIIVVLFLKVGPPGGGGFFQSFMEQIKTRQPQADINAAIRSLGGIPTPR